MAKSKKEMIENAVSKLRGIDSIKRIQLQIFMKDWNPITSTTNVQPNKTYSTKKEVIKRFCRKELFNRHAPEEPIPSDLSLSNVDHIVLKKLD